MKGFSAATPNIIKNLRKLSTSRAVENPFMWPLTAFENSQKDLESFFLEAISKTIFKYPKNYNVNKFKNQKRTYREYWFNFVDHKRNLVSSETVPLYIDSPDLDFIYTGPGKRDFCCGYGQRGPGIYLHLVSVWLF